MEDMECGVCRQEYDDNVKHAPYIIPGCGHTACATCAKKLFENKTIKCPFDRKITHFIEEDVIKCLKPNYKILEAITEQKNKLKKLYEKDYEKEIALGILCAENEAHIAVLYCTVCKAHYCKMCSITSHSSKSQSTHKMVKVTEKPEPLLMCPLHQHNVAGLYCQDMGCDITSKLMCVNCHLYGVHKGHECKSIEILEAKKKMADDIVNKTNTKKELIKSHLNSIGELPECVESYEEYIKVKNHIDGTYNQHLQELDNWKKANLDELRKQANDIIQERKKEKDIYYSQLEELETVSHECLNVKKQGKIEFFEKSANIEMIGKKFYGVNIKEPGKQIELVPLIKPLHFLSETKKAKRKIVFVSDNALLQNCWDRLKEFDEFKGVVNNSFHMEDRHGNPYSAYFWDDVIFQTSSINMSENTTFVVLCLHEMIIEKMKELSKGAKIIMGWSKAKLMEMDFCKDNIITFSQISAPIFLADFSEELSIKDICEGNYENNPFFELFLNEPNELNK